MFFAPLYPKHNFGHPWLLAILQKGISPSLPHTYHPHLKNPSPAQPSPHSTCHHEGKVKAFLHGLAVNLIGEGRKAHILLVILVSGRWSVSGRARGSRGPQDLTWAFSLPPQSLPSLRGAVPDSTSWAADPADTVSFQCILGPTHRAGPNTGQREAPAQHA